MQKLLPAEIRELWTEKGARLPEAHLKAECGRCLSKTGVLIRKGKGAVDVEADSSMLCLLYSPLHEALSTVNSKGDVGKKETRNVDSRVVQSSWGARAW